MRYVVVVGGTNVDVVARPAAAAVPATSNPGRVSVAAGGVGRNIAENLARLGTRTVLLSSVGDDEHAALALAVTAGAGVDTSHVRRTEGATGRYVAMLDADGELVAAVSDMPSELTPDDVLAAAALLGGAALVVLDGNLAVDTLEAAWDAAGGPVVVDPVSVPKAGRIGPTVGARRALLVSAGVEEIAALGPFEADLVWTRRGPGGSRLVTSETTVELASLPTDVVDVTGAGDAMLAAWCHAWLAGTDPVAAAEYAHAAAALTVASPHTVRPDLSDELVRSLL